MRIIDGSLIGFILLTSVAGVHLWASQHEEPKKQGILYMDRCEFKRAVTSCNAIATKRQKKDPSYQNTCDHQARVFAYTRTPDRVPQACLVMTDL